MEYVIWFIFAFTILQFLVALVNLLFRQRPKGVLSEPLPLVSVLIPARNEARNISVLLADLVHQNYPNVEILVFDDDSEDGTGDVVSRFAATDSRVRLIPNADLPDGWLGKSWGCYNLAQAANGRCYLFLDADVRVQGDVIHDSVALLIKSKVGLLSLFPKQLMLTTGERITVPVMHYILLSLLPLILVRYSRFSSLSAANGQFMLFDAEVYQRHDPHKHVKMERAEDIRIARMFKRNRVRVICSAGSTDVTCRMYHGFHDAVNGFSKNITAFFGGSTVVAILFWLITTPGILLVFLYADLFFLAIYTVLFLLTKIMISVTAGQHVLLNLALFVPQHMATGWIIFRSFTRNLTNRQQWKGRYI